MVSKLFQILVLPTNLEQLIQFYGAWISLYMYSYNKLESAGSYRPKQNRLKWLKKKIYTAAMGLVIANSAFLASRLAVRNSSTIKFEYSKEWLSLAIALSAIVGVLLTLSQLIRASNSDGKDEWGGRHIRD